jgi:hypothetical protein
MVLPWSGRAGDLREAQLGVTSEEEKSGGEDGKLRLAPRNPPVLGVMRVLMDLCWLQIGYIAKKAST